MLDLWTALRRSSVMDLAICALMAFVAAIAMDELEGRGSELFVGVLLGLGLGLGFMALALWGRRRSLG